MNNEGKNKANEPGNERSDKADELIGKGKKFADKAEDFFAEKVSKVKHSDAFGKFAGLFDKVENFMEDKAEEFQSGEMGAKFEAFKDKAGDQAGGLVKKAKEAGRKIGDQVDDTIDSFKGKKGSASNQDGEGI